MTVRTLSYTLISTALAASGASSLHAAQADATDEIAARVGIEFRLRYEHVDQNNALDNADALTLRTRLNYKTRTFEGLSGFVEFEDSRDLLGVDDYNDGTGSRPGYSVIADPETTELDQGYLQYTDYGLTARLGRQVITLDNQRFIGDVGWRQDRQTFDAITLAYGPANGLSLFYGYLQQRNRIFAEEQDLDAKDHLLNAAWAGPWGTLTAYSYLLEIDEGADNSLDTYGLRFSGQTAFNDATLLYTAEFATQESETGSLEFHADYTLLEVGGQLQGVSVRLGYEVLGSDDGNYGFSTPLATLHAFNGTADQFLATPAEGLEDLYLALGGDAWGGKWQLAYHDFSADDASATVDDLGDELDLQYSYPLSKQYAVGIKGAFYSQGDAGAGRVDTDKVWLWVSGKF